MPEGPSIVILKESVQSFMGKMVVVAGGNTKKLDPQRLEGEVVLDFKSWGKHFIICFSGFAVKVHFLLYGSYLIDAQKDRPARLSLEFKTGKINFYTCSVQLIEQNPDEVYDWSADVMNHNWDGAKALKKLQNNPDMLVCDALLDQHIFAGVGNIMKNEILFRIRVHPESAVGKLPLGKLKELIREAVRYSFEFLTWKKEYTLKKHYLAYTKRICPRDQIPFQKGQTGKTHRRSFFCARCQRLYF